MSEESDQQHAAPTLDLRSARVRLSGNEQLLKDLARFFVDDVPEMLDQVQSCLENGENARAAQAAHGLHNLAANFTAQPAAAMASELESLVRSGETRKAAVLLSQMKPQFLAVVDMLQEAILHEE